MAQISRGKIVKRTWKWNGQKRVAYVFDVMVDGRRVRKQYPGKQEAQDELDKFRDAAKNPTPAIVEPTPAPTLAEAFAKFLALKSNKKTAHEFQRVAEHLKSAFGADTRLTDITSARIADYRSSGWPCVVAASRSRRPQSTGRSGCFGTSCVRRPNGG
jgi:hypothetical protein